LFEAKLAGQSGQVAYVYSEGSALLRLGGLDSSLVIGEEGDLSITCGDTPDQWLCYFSARFGFDDKTDGIGRGFGGSGPVSCLQPRGDSKAWSHCRPDPDGSLSLARLKERWPATPRILLETAISLSDHMNALRASGSQPFAEALRRLRMEMKVDELLRRFQFEAAGQSFVECVLDSAVRLKRRFNSLRDLAHWVRKSELCDPVSRIWGRAFNTFTVDFSEEGLREALAPPHRHAQFRRAESRRVRSIRRL
jgi:hypothetical protein